MISNEKFVRESLETNLFFLRIMKEHMIFIGSSLTPRDSNFNLFSQKLRSKLEDLLRRTIRVSNGIISDEVSRSGELVTNFTLNAEKKTEFYTGGHIDTDITRSEIRLVQRGNQNVNITSRIVNETQDINCDVLDILKEVIKFKTKLLENVKECKMFTTLYPLLIDHVLREAKFYFDIINRLQNREDLSFVEEVILQEDFWNRIMKEHSEFIRGGLDPTEEKLIELANNFSKDFGTLGEKSHALKENIRQLEEFTKESLKYTKELRDFKRQGTEGILNCSIMSIILPLLADHVLREANHYLRLLNSYNKNL